jgi:hypothetical protein
MKKDFHNMLQMKVGRSPISHPYLIAFLDKMGYDKGERKEIIKTYFSPSINHYRLKKFPEDV